MDNRSLKHAILTRCRSHGVKVTPLREAVLDLLLTSTGLIKAYDILARLQETSPTPIAPPTAYRSLDFWAQQGVLHKVPSMNGYVLCLHRATGAHGCGHAADEGVCFLACTECGAVQEQVLPALWQSLQGALGDTGFVWNDPHLVLTGRCCRCSGGDDTE